MKIEKAIEILTTHTKEPCTISFDDLKEAEKLGIEALKRVKDNRENLLPFAFHALPGETEE